MLHFLRSGLKSYSLELSSFVYSKHSRPEICLLIKSLEPEEESQKLKKRRIANESFIVLAEELMMYIDTMRNGNYNFSRKMSSIEHSKTCVMKRHLPVPFTSFDQSKTTANHCV